MAVSLIYFVSSLLIIGASIKSFSHLSRWKAFMLVAASVAYSLFCFMAFKEVEGMAPDARMEQIIAQQGFDASSIPVPLGLVMTMTFCGDILFNVLTCVWVWVRGGLWKWCLTMAAGFCVVCVCAGFVVGLSPLYSLFGGCCAFMAVVGWVLGLTYVEFCVIGNIWIPCAAIIGTAIFLIYASCSCLKLRPGNIRFLSVGTILFAVLQIAMSFLLLYHYAGTMHDAFFRCVHDLRYLAAIAHKSYEAVNIFLWVFVGVSLLSFNIAMGKYLLKRGRLRKKR